MLVKAVGRDTYHVRFIEKLDPLTQAVVDYKHIWGVPKHNMLEFYDACLDDWPELPAFNTSRQAVRRGTGRPALTGIWLTNPPASPGGQIQCVPCAHTVYLPYVHTLG